MLNWENNLDAWVEKMLPQETSHATTGLISQSISIRTEDTWNHWKSPGESGYNLVKLDIYPVSDIRKQKLRRTNDYWKAAKYRTYFLTKSAVDPQQMLIDKILKKAISTVLSIPDVKKEVSHRAYHVCI